MRFSKYLFITLFYSIFAYANSINPSCLENVIYSMSLTRFNSKSANFIYHLIHDYKSFPDLNSLKGKIKFSDLISDNEFILWFKNHGKELIYTSRDIESRLDELNKSGILDILKDIERSYESPAFLALDKKTLPSLGFKKNPYGTSYAHLNDYYYHSTSMAYDPLKAFNSISSSEHARPNALISRINYPGEAAHQGEGFYASPYIEGRRGGTIDKAGIQEQMKDYEEYVVKLDIREAKEARSGLAYDENKETLIIKNRDIVKVVPYVKSDETTFIKTLLDPKTRKPNWLLDFSHYLEVGISNTHLNQLAHYLESNFDFYSFKLWSKLEKASEKKQRLFKYYKPT